jgi:hypothetical protein
MSPPGARPLLILPSRKHHSRRIKPIVMNDYYSSSKAVEAGSTSSPLIGSVGVPPTPTLGRPPSSRARFVSCLIQSLLVPSRLQKSCAWPFCLYVNLTCGPSLVLFSRHPAEIGIHQNSWNSISRPPISMW